MILKIKKLNENAAIPSYAHGPDEDAGFDLRSVETVNLKPLVPVHVKTGLSIELPSGFEAQIRPRSGLALKYGLMVVNSPGTIDPSYRGEIGVILMWTGAYPKKDSEDTLLRGVGFVNSYFQVNPGDRIAQMVVARYEPVNEFQVVEDLGQSTRGAAGLGSTGLA